MEPLPDLIVGHLASTDVDEGAWRFDFDDQNRSLVVLHLEYESDVDRFGAGTGKVVLLWDIEGVRGIEEMG